MFHVHLLLLFREKALNIMKWKIISKSEKFSLLSFRGKILLWKYGYIVKPIMKNQTIMNFKKTNLENEPIWLRKDYSMRLFSDILKELITKKPITQEMSSNFIYSATKFRTELWFDIILKMYSKASDEFIVQN